jgi:hypothetical protein
MSEDERPFGPGTPPPPPPGTPPLSASAGGPPPFGPPPFGPTPAPAPGSAPPAFSVQLPSVDVQALAKTPWVVGAAAILIGLVLYWAGSVVSAFQHDVGYDARQRLIHLLGAGDVDWAVAILLAVALLVLGSSGEAKRAPLATFLYQLLLLAAALIAVAAAINAVIDLTYIGSSFDASLYGFLEYLAAVPIAGAGVLWAWRANPVALPGQKPKAK